MSDSKFPDEDRIVALLRAEALCHSPIDVVKILKRTVGEGLSQFQATVYLWKAFSEMPKVDLNMAAASSHIVGEGGARDEEINTALGPWFDARRNKIPPKGVVG